MKSLFEIGTDLEALDSLIDDVNGEISDITVEAALVEWFDQLSKDEGIKLDNYCGLIRQLEVDVITAKGEAEAFRRKAADRERRVDWLKSRLAEHLQRTNRTKVTTVRGRTISLQNNGGKPPLGINWDFVDLDELDPKYIKTRRELDQDAIRAALERGEEFGFAMICERGQHLRIK
jgi:hypothetical protein